MRSMKVFTAALAGALLALPAVSEAGTLFRFPMSMLADQCGNGGCKVSAYKDHSGRDYACGGVRYNGHLGTDYYLVGEWAQMDRGTWVISAAAGSVFAAKDGFFDRCDYINSNPDGTCGIRAANYMMLRHSDGRQSKYFHLKKYTQQYALYANVPCGQWLAQAGSSGASTKPHLHFEFWDPNWGTDDPYSGSCGGPVSLWTAQGGYLGLPGTTCQ